MSQWNSDWINDWNLNWFGNGFAVGFVDGFGDAGVATLVLDIENGFTLTHEWRTDVIARKDGTEQRISRNDVARQSIKGSAVLLGDKPRNVRALMARYAAQGAVFQLGLPHEQIAIRADASGTTVYVASTASLDWAAIGQRIVVAHPNDDDETDYVAAVIQAVGVDSLELDVEPGIIGARGGWVMPTVPVFLEPEQAFPRYESDAERWEIDARLALLDFAPSLASLELSSFLSNPIFADLRVVSRRYGIIGNTFVFETDGDIGFTDGVLVEEEPLTLFRFGPDVTTLGNLATALDGSTQMMLVGDYDPDATFDDADEGFGTLSGATATGFVGRGATVVTYDGDGTERPVWDRRLHINGTSSDSVHGMTAIVDHGGIITALGLADDADWGRQVLINNGSFEEWQWWKLFLWTVRGRQKSWWLPTWRDDLTFVSLSVDQLIVRLDDGSDLLGWFPRLRQHIQIAHTDGTVSYAKIVSAVDNNDDTATLTVDPAPASGGTVSWLELCRFERDEFAITFDQHGFNV